MLAFLFNCIIKFVCYQTCHAGDKCSEATEVRTYYKSTSVFGEGGKKHGSRNVTDYL